ncbi:MAG TPA: hypothetical protein VF450_05870 [Noviherbaspirillum sp.]
MDNQSGQIKVEYTSRRPCCALATNTPPMSPNISAPGIDFRRYMAKTSTCSEVALLPNNEVRNSVDPLLITIRISQSGRSIQKYVFQTRNPISVPDNIGINVPIFDW